MCLINTIAHRLVALTMRIGINSPAVTVPPAAASAEWIDDLHPIAASDFRRVYATVAQGWLDLPDTSAVLGGRFEPFPVFG